MELESKLHSAGWSFISAPPTKNSLRIIAGDWLAILERETRHGLVVGIQQLCAQSPTFFHPNIHGELTSRNIARFRHRLAESDSTGG